MLALWRLDAALIRGRRWQQWLPAVCLTLCFACAALAMWCRLSGARVMYSEDGEGNGVFSFTEEEVNLEWEGCPGGGSRKGALRRRLLASSPVATTSRRLLQTSAGVQGIASLGEDGQVRMCCEGGLSFLHGSRASHQLRQLVVTSLKEMMSWL